MFYILNCRINYAFNTICKLFTCKICFIFNYLHYSPFEINTFIDPSPFPIGATGVQRNQEHFLDFNVKDKKKGIKYIYTNYMHYFNFILFSLPFEALIE